MTWLNRAWMVVWQLQALLLFLLGLLHITAAQFLGTIEAFIEIIVGVVVSVSIPHTY